MQLPLQSLLDSPGGVDGLLFLGWSQCPRAAAHRDWLGSAAETRRLAKQRASEHSEQIEQQESVELDAPLQLFKFPQYMHVQNQDEECLVT